MKILFTLLIFLGFVSFLRHQLSQPGSIFFPNIKTIEGIYKACRVSSYSQALLTLIFTLFTCPYYFHIYAVFSKFIVISLSILLFVVYSALAIFSFKLSRVANTLALLLYLSNWVLVVKDNLDSLDFQVLTLFSIFVFCFGWPMVQGIRASFAYPKIKKQYLEENISLPSPPAFLSGVAKKLFPEIVSLEKANEICTRIASIICLCALIFLADSMIKLFNGSKLVTQIPSLVTGLSYLILGDLIKKRMKGASLFFLLVLVLEILYGIFFHKDILVINLSRLAFVLIVLPSLINSHRAALKDLDLPQPVIKTELNSIEVATKKPTNILSFLNLYLPKIMFVVLLFLILIAFVMFLIVKFGVV
jgi:hypothetical protein